MAIAGRVGSWRVDNVAAYLHQLELSQLVPAFKENVSGWRGRC